MSARSPRQLGELLSYLDGIGFDSLYVDRAAPGSRAAADNRSASTDRRSQTAALPGQAAVARSPKPAVVAPVLSVDAANERFDTLDAGRQQAETCTACALSQRRRSVVFGSGRLDADLMLIGEGPGAEEDRQGLPFVGPAGALLSRILEAIGERRDGVYITNTVKCRPPGNRNPAPDEVAACRSYLDAQIDLIKPRVLVALGRVAAQALLDSTAPLRDLRGRWHQVRGVETRVTYHPAALLRYAKYKRPTWEDLQVVRDRLAELTGV